MSYITSIEQLGREEDLQQDQPKQDVIIVKRMLTRDYGREEIKEITHLSDQDLLDLEDQY